MNPTLPRPLRITFLSPPPNLSGGQRVIAIYAGMLAARGHEVEVVCSRGRALSFTDRVKRFAKGEGSTRPAPPTAVHYAGYGVNYRVLDHPGPIRGEDVSDSDLLIATWWETAEWLAAMPAQKGVKVYFIQHDEAHESQPAERVHATWTLPMHKITIAQWLVDRARDAFGDDQVSLVPNSVDPAQFHAPPRAKPSPPVVGMLYTRTRWKGCDIAIEAVRRARRAVPALGLVAFGDRKPAARLPLPAESVFHCRPDQAELRAIYAGCTGWLFASRREGFGLPLLEAMACRTPVIATPVGAAPELLQAGGGYRVDPDDPAAMAEKIEALCALTEPAWAAMSEAAYRTARRYSWPEACDRFEAALGRAMARAAAGEVAGRARTEPTPTVQQEAKA